MTYDEYQLSAHSTAVYGDNNSYPIMAVAEETAEVVDVWGSYMVDDPSPKALTKEVLDKFRDEIGDVCWNVAELMTVLRKRLSESNPVDSVGYTDLKFGAYTLCKLVRKVGKIEGIYAKWTRKHNGVQPTNEELIHQTDIATEVEHLWSLVRYFILSIGLKVDDVLQHNLTKLAARKANNTLGGAGSVARKE